MNTLYFEVVGSVVLAGLLGLGTGWMMQRARAARRLRLTVAVWEQRCDELLPREEENTASLQEQVYELDRLLGAENARTRDLEAQLGAVGTRLEKARGDAIRLNSQQAGIQERLQRIIREKDHELGELARRADRDATRAAHDPAPSPAPSSPADPVDAAAGVEIEAYIDRLSDRGERTRHDAGPVAPPATLSGPTPAPVETVPSPAVALPVDLPDPRTGPVATLFDDGFDDDLDDTLDATAVIDMETEREVHAGRHTDPVDDPFDATSQEALLYDEDTIAFDEDTIAFDEATLARVRERSH